MKRILPLLLGITSLLLAGEYPVNLQQSGNEPLSQKILLAPETDLSSVAVRAVRKRGAGSSAAVPFQIPAAVNDQMISAAPTEQGEYLLKTGQLGAYKLVDLTIFSPNQYESFTITANENSARSGSAPRSSHKNELSNLVSNPEQLNLYGTTARSESAPGYAILIPETRLSSVPSLDEFIALKKEKGFEVHLITSSDWGGGTGDEAAENIRSWIDANYEPLNLEYLFFIGYPHPERGDVPMKMTWPQFQLEEYREAPTDFYYAELTGNWDVDGDGNYGEFEDDFMVNGGPDQYAELKIGRIPVYTKTNPDIIIQKLIRYEKETQESAESWRLNTLLAMNSMNAETDPNFTPGIRLGEAIKYDILEPNGVSSFRIYDDNYEGFGLQTPADSTPCDYGSVKESWNNYDFGLVVWQAHGFAQHATDVMSIPYSKVLKDDRVPFVFASSCHNGRPETDNLSHYLLLNGAVNVVSASRVEYWAPGQDKNWDIWPTGGSFAYLYSKFLVEDSLSSAAALNKIKSDVHTIMIQSNSMWWMNWLVYNVYGDPSQSIYSWEKNDTTPLVDIVDSPHRSGVAIHGNLLRVGEPLQFSHNIHGLSSISVKIFDCVGNCVTEKEFRSPAKGTTAKVSVDGTGSLLASFTLQFENGGREQFSTIIGVQR